MTSSSRCRRSTGSPDLQFVHTHTHTHQLMHIYVYRLKGLGHKVVVVLYVNPICICERHVIWTKVVQVFCVRGITILLVT